MCVSHVTKISRKMRHLPVARSDFLEDISHTKIRKTVLEMKNKNHGITRTFFYTAILTVSCSFACAQESSFPSVTDAAPDLQAQASRYALQYESMASEFGPYDLRVTEPLVAAADLQAEAGNYLDALQGYEQALQVTRISTGLFSEEQIPLVEKIIDCNVSTGDWPRVDEQFRYLELLYSRVYEQGSEGWARGIAQLSDWHVLVINHGLETNNSDHLREAHSLLKQRLRLAENSADTDEKVLEVLRHNVDLTTHYLRMAERHSAEQAFDNARLSLVENTGWTY
jgi:tetratricopeptide (TPR) repeat protein